MTYGLPSEGMTSGKWIVHLLEFAQFCMTSLRYSSSLAPSGDSQALFWGCCRPLVVGMFFLSFCLVFVVQDFGTESFKGRRL